ncbi:unnamed protein product [Vicia faba]|uniref:AP2/ERF domain-containing protein n=1 Tax=Vicia faba TaxID=3906 RepID=A0AAV1ATS1_VICFA|nr:unnamed protein product [Vicia faba]
MDMFQHKQRKRLWLGTFNSAEEAAAEYDRVAVSLRGPHAVTNFPILPAKVETQVPPPLNGGNYGWIEGVVETLGTLEFSSLPHLKTLLPECLTTMTHLKKLRILYCFQLLSLPSDFHQLTSLEDLFIHGCPKLFQKYQPESGEY